MAGRRRARPGGRHLLSLTGQSPTVARGPVSEESTRVWNVTVRFATRHVAGAPPTTMTERRRHRCSSEPSDRGRSARSGSAACRCRSRAARTRTARSRPSTPRSTPASPSSTRPTPTTCDADEVGHNESLIAEALATYGGDTSDVLVATKGGHLRPGDGSWTLDGSPGAPQGGVRGVAPAARRRRHRALPVPPSRPERALRRVGRCDPRPARRGRDPDGRHLQRQPRADPRWPRRSSAAGSCRCRTSSRRPSASSEPELELCDELGIAFLPWSPLGGISQGRGARQPARRLRRGGRGARRRARSRWRSPGSSRSSPVVDPDPRRVASGDDPRTRRQAADLELTADEVARLSAETVD